MKALKAMIFGSFAVMLALAVLTEWSVRTRRDSVPPIIQCDSEILEVSVKAGETELLKGVTAYDSRDGDITDRIMVEHVSNLISENTARITYVVLDNADNAATCSRTIRYTDYQKPRFTLDKPLSFYVGDTITMLDRLTAVDVIDGDITEKIRMTASNLTNSLAGTYHVTVQVTNSLGDTTVLPLTIDIVSGTDYHRPQIKLNDYLIYLNQGAIFDPMDYLVSVTDSGAANPSVSRSAVEIQSSVDTSEPGVYEVVYSYTGAVKETKSILTVVVI